MAISYGIDLSSATSYAYGTDYSGYFESMLYTVGTINNKKTFEQLEFQLDRELATDEGIRIKYRVNLTDAWTTIGTYTYATLGAKISHNVIPGIPACELLQIRVEFKGTSTTTPSFKMLVLK